MVLISIRVPVAVWTQINIFKEKQEKQSNTKKQEK